MSNITLDEIFQNYFKDSFIENVTCETCSSIRSEVRKIKFTVCLSLKSPP